MTNFEDMELYRTCWEAIISNDGSSITGASIQNITESSPADCPSTVARPEPSPEVLGAEEVLGPSRRGLEDGVNCVWVDMRRVKRSCVGYWLWDRVLMVLQHDAVFIFKAVASRSGDDVTAIEPESIQKYRFFDLRFSASNTYQVEGAFRLLHSDEADDTKKALVFKAGVLRGPRVNVSITVFQVESASQRTVVRALLIEARVRSGAVLGLGLGQGLKSWV